MQRTILIEQFRFRPPFLFVCPCLRDIPALYKTAQRIYNYRHLDMVEIISPLDSPIILVFRQLIAVTKFGRGHQQLTCLDLILSNHAVFDDLG